VKKSKVCKGCKEALPLSNFNKHANGVNNLRARCKKCFALYRKESALRIKKKNALLAKGKRTCTTCKKTKAISAFRPKVHAGGSRGYEGACRSCTADRIKTRSKIRNKDAREFIFNYLNARSCVDCGESNILVLEFDHVKNKSFDIGKALNNGTPLRLIKLETKKCQIRCSNCHRIKTHFEADTWRYQMSQERG
jgi:hypothetical protein